ncbi:MAG: 50S ribosomal protein L25 [Solirubrobacterales bacterium]|nr:50S ribosomal protein L25 [Solirubrobacterales bacterium]
MGTSTATKLELQSRDTAGGSRAVRRLRRKGLVPGVLYGGDDAPVSFQVDERVLRHALAASGAVLELAIDGQSQPAVLKDAQHDVVRGDTLHIDLLRVRLDVKIHAVVYLELQGGDESPGVIQGGVLDQVTHELHVEALPGDIPAAIVHDVSGLQMNDSLTLTAVRPPPGVELLDDLEETVIANLAPPTVDVDAEEEEIEAETERIGEVGEGAGELEGSQADAGAQEVAPRDGNP